MFNIIFSTINSEIYYTIKNEDDLSKCLKTYFYIMARELIKTNDYYKKDLKIDITKSKDIFNSYSKLFKNQTLHIDAVLKIL